jgi:hypothetical protein
MRILAICCLLFISISLHAQYNKHAKIDSLQVEAKMIYHYHNQNDEDIPMSVFSINDAQTIFNYYKAKKKFAWKWPNDCYAARAMLIARDLETKGIYCGKFIALGRLSMKTKNDPGGIALMQTYVAIVVLVEDSIENKPMVIDPTFFDGPIDASSWGSNWLEVKKNSGVSMFGIFSRFTYALWKVADVETSDGSYNLDDVKESTDNLCTCKQLQDERFHNK